LDPWTPSGRTRTPFEVWLVMAARIVHACDSAIVIDTLRRCTDY
jgi:hypothetical protein